MNIRGLVIFLSALLLSAAAYADDGWVVSAKGECRDYTGAAAANGTMGILHWKEPFSVRQIVLNNVFELNDQTAVNCAVLGINPFELALTVDGVAPEGYSHWSQSIDMKKAQHNTSFRVADKLEISYSLVALRNLPHTALFKVNVKALDDASVAFEKSVSVPYGYQQPRYSHKEFFADGRRICLQQTDALTAHGRYDVSAASMFIYDEAAGHYAAKDGKAVLSFDMTSGESVEFCVVGSICCIDRANVAGGTAVATQLILVHLGGYAILLLIGTVLVVGFLIDQLTGTSGIENTVVGGSRLIIMLYPCKAGSAAVHGQVVEDDVFAAGLYGDGRAAVVATAGKDITLGRALVNILGNAHLASAVRKTCCGTTNRLRHGRKPCPWETEDSE